ncbi:MAG: family 78 glycoside hydrolase catalytic domain [Bacteroidales bacterium]
MSHLPGFLSGKPKPIIYPLLILLSSLIYSCNQYTLNSNIKPVNLKCNYRINPLGTDIQIPRFSWQVHDTSKQSMQKAYQILVSTSPEKLKKDTGDIWNSGKIGSGQSLHISYEGPDLKPATRYYWKVKIWDSRGRVSPYSDIQWFETGLLKKEDWKANWISTSAWEKGVPPANPAPYFRKSFEINQSIEEARMYISGLGYYEFYINGQRVGDHQLDPAVTDYEERVKYNTYDVGKYLKKGKNVMVVVLGHGWYNQHSPSAWDFHKAPWRESQVFTGQLQYKDVKGQKHTVISDNTWKYKRGPIVYNSIRNGEFYDAGKYSEQWFLPGYDDKSWTGALEVSGPKGRLSAQKLPPMRIIKTLEVEEITQPQPGTWVFDFGQNIAGWTKLNVKGTRGDTITIEHGERLYEDGTLDQEELSRFVNEGPTQTNKYTLSGEGTETWEPSFSYHGFRYASVTGLHEAPDSSTLKAQVVHTDFDTAGTFFSSDSVLNQIHRNTQWSYLGNFHGYPEDCPHREKIGWSGDGQAAAEVGFWNFHSTTAYRKWLDDFLDEQRASGELPGIIPTSGWGYTRGEDTVLGYGPQWEGAFLTIPWNIYLYKGDERILRRYYDGIKKYMGYLESQADNYLLNGGINDHKYVDTPTEPPIIASSYFYHLTRITAKMAAVMNHEEDRRHYKDLARNIKKAYNKKYYHPEDQTYGNGGQTSLAMALYFGLVKEQNEQEVLNSLVEEINNQDNHFDAGVIGVKCLINVLTEHGLTDLAYEMITQKTYPGYEDWIERGATTLWQTWDGSMSRNHIMFGSVDEWFFEALAGIKIDPEHPGFKHFFLEPQIPEKLTHAQARHHCMYGEIKSAWRKKENGTAFKFNVPFNTSATITLPADKGKEILEGDAPLSEQQNIEIISRKAGKVVMKLGSGSYDFLVN